jgi:osmoprotectant transport system permease protein
MAIATLAFIAGAGGLGSELIPQPSFKTNIIMVAVLVVVMAIVFDLMLLLLQRLVTPWRRAVPA